MYRVAPTSCVFVNEYFQIVGFGLQSIGIGPTYCYQRIYSESMEQQSKRIAINLQSYFHYQQNFHGGACSGAYHILLPARRSWRRQTSFQCDNCLMVSIQKCESVLCSCPAVVQCLFINSDTKAGGLLTLSDVCPSCDKETDDAVVCQWCSKWEHKNKYK